MPSAEQFLDEGVGVEDAPSSPSATEFLDAEPEAPKAADFLDKIPDEPFNVTGESVGAPGDIARGFQDAGGFGSIPGELLQTLSPVTGSIQDLKRTYEAARDMITGAKTFDEAAKTYFPETQKLVGIEKKPIRQRVEAAADILMQMAFAGETAKGLQFSKNARTAEPVKTEPAPVEPAVAGDAPALQTITDQVNTGLAAGEFLDQPERVAIDTFPDQTLPPKRISEPPAAASPSVAADEVIASTPKTETQTAPAISRSVFDIPSSEIATRPELMQFKQMDNAATGTATEARITTPYDPVKAQNLLLWEPTNPQEYGLAPNEKYIVANGHYRNEAAQQQNVPSQNAQILRESAGVSAADARGIAAWANIADGKGTIYDQARFIRSEAIRGGPDAAVVRAREIGARSRKAESIAAYGSDDLYTSFINEQITPEIAASIADAAPGNAALQRVGLAEALEGASGTDIANLLDSVSSGGTEAPTSEQIDLLASDDSAMAQMRESAKRATAIQKEIQDQISAVQGAAKRPEKARALGVNVEDQAAVEAKLDQLRALRERARPGVWKFDPEIRDIAMRSQLDAGGAVRQLQAPLGGPGTPGASEIPIGSVGKEPAVKTFEAPAARVGGRTFVAATHANAAENAVKAGFTIDQVHAENPTLTNWFVDGVTRDDIHRGEISGTPQLREHSDIIAAKKRKGSVGKEPTFYHGSRTGKLKPDATGLLYVSTDPGYAKQFTDPMQIGEKNAKFFSGKLSLKNPKEYRSENESEFNAFTQRGISAEALAKEGHDGAILTRGGKIVDAAVIDSKQFLPEQTKSSALAEPTTATASREEIGTQGSGKFQKGDLVTLTQPTLHGPKQVTGTVDLKPTGNQLEVRLQQGGIVKIDARDATLHRAAPDLSLAAPESDAEMAARQQAEADANAARQGSAERAAQVKYGWQQKKTGDAGDLGQGDLLAPEQQDIWGFGPGAAAEGEMLLRQRQGSQLKQLSAVVHEQLKTNTPPTQQMNKAVAAAGKQPTPATPAKAPGPVAPPSASRAQATWMVLRNFFRNPQYSLRWGSSATDFMDALKTWQGLDQRTSFEVRRWSRDMRKRLDKLTDDAITNYIQADGDTALLQQRAAATSDPELRAGYERALNLTPEEQTIAANGRQYFDSMLNDGINAGILDHGLENYITQVWKKPNKITNALIADLQAGKLQLSFKFARQRIFNSYFEGEQAGYTPGTKRFSDLIAIYDLAFNRSLAARGFINALRQAKAADGEPVIKFSGMVQAIPRGQVPPDAYLIRASALPKNAVTQAGDRYLPINHPALRGWKMAYQLGKEIPTYFQSDMLVHPDHWEHLNNVLKTSVFRTGWTGKIATPFLKVGAIAKQTRLSMSIFHLDQEGLHGLFHRVNPANLEHINFDDPVQWRLIRNGLQVSDYSAMELFSEGLRGGGLVSYIPGLGPLQNNFNEFLFKDGIPRLKMTMALHAYERNAVRYPKLSADVIAELTAKQANAAFGELNYKLLGRSPTTQDLMRLTLLAPDFLEGRSRFVGQALKPYGQEQRAALFLGAATLYATARVLNQWLDNDAHWEPSKAFSVIYNGREYRLRTVMGDAVALATDPRRFFYNRFSPWLKTATTYVTGRDYRGIKLNAKEQVMDALSWFVPIPLAQGNEASSVKQWVQQFPNRALSSAGVENKPAETAIDHVYRAALDFKATLKDPKIRAELIRAQQETYVQGDYSRLNRALIDNDKERATAEIVGLMKDKGKTGLALAEYYSNLPMLPFTGSRILDAQWLRSMPAVQRQQYQIAVQQRIAMARLFAQLYPNAFREFRKGN